MARRVRQGGHHIPEDVIRRRYLNGIYNLVNLFLPIVDKWSIYDNSDYTSGHPEIVAEQFPKETVIIENVEVWDILNNISNTKK